MSQYRSLKLSQRFFIHEIHEEFTWRNIQFFNKCGIPNIFNRRRTSQFLRIRNFINSGTTCKMCGAKGTHYKLVVDNNDCFSFQLFTENNQLMTLDHVVPLSKDGRKHDMSNHQTLCATCNNVRKGNKII